MPYTPDMLGQNFQNITTQATTVLKAGAGLLERIIINTPLALSVITIYDNTAGSGTKIGTITLPAALLSSGVMSASYGVKFSTGLTIVTTGANADITVVFS